MLQVNSFYVVGIANNLGAEFSGYGRIYLSASFQLSSCKARESYCPDKSYNRNIFGAWPLGFQS